MEVFKDSDSVTLQDLSRSLCMTFVSGVIPSAGFREISVYSYTHCFYALCSHVMHLHLG